MAFKEGKVFAVVPNFIPHPTKQRQAPFFRAFQRRWVLERPVETLGLTGACVSPWASLQKARVKKAFALGKVQGCLTGGPNRATSATAGSWALGAATRPTFCHRYAPIRAPRKAALGDP